MVISENSTSVKNAEAAIYLTAVLKYLVLHIVRFLIGEHLVCSLRSPNGLIIFNSCGRYGSFIQGPGR